MGWVGNDVLYDTSGIEVTLIMLGYFYVGENYVGSRGVKLLIKAEFQLLQKLRLSNHRLMQTTAVWGTKAPSSYQRAHGQASLPSIYVPIKHTRPQLDKIRRVVKHGNQQQLEQHVVSPSLLGAWQQWTSINPMSGRLQLAVQGYTDLHIALLQTPQVCGLRDQTQVHQSVGEGDIIWAPF